MSKSISSKGHVRSRNPTRRDESPKLRPDLTSGSDSNNEEKAGYQSDGDGDINDVVRPKSLPETGHPQVQGTSSSQQTRKNQSEVSKAKARAREETTPSGQNVNLDTFVSFKSLSRLMRVKPNSRGHFVTSFYKYEKSLSSLQIRVRLLKYPSLTQRAEWSDDLLVLEDRIFSWQEKVFSKSEAEFYGNKKNIITDIDDQYHKEIVGNPAVEIGKHFHSYIQSDFLTNDKDLPNPTWRRCANKHTRRMTKLAGSLLEAKLVNSDGESVVDDENYEDADYQKSIIPTKHFAERFTSIETAIGGNLKSKLPTDIIERSRAFPLPLRQNLTPKERQREQERANAEDVRERDGKIDKERKERTLTIKNVQNLSAGSKAKKDTKIIDKGTDYAKLWVGSQRPSEALSAHIKSGQMTPSKSPKFLKKSWGKAKDNEYEEFGNKPGSIRGRSGTTRKSDKTSSIEEILEPRLLTEQSKIGDADPNFSASELIGKSVPISTNEIPSPSRVKSDTKILPRRQTLIGSRRFNVSNRRSAVKSFRKGSQMMYIMANIPHSTRRKRNIVVCSLQTSPKAGVLLLKPEFGYRIIEAKRNQVYRLSWELLKPNEEKSEKIETRKTLRDGLRQPQPIEGERENAKDDSLLEQVGEMFEMVSSKEMRLIVMGEILSTGGFERDPICIHYFMEIPKGWRNDSVSSSLIGITHCCYNNSELIAHFSHHFFCQLAFSMDSVDEHETYPRPMLILMVVALVSPARIRHEGYAYVPIPSKPGLHEITIQTWKPKARTTRDNMLDTFLDITPSLQDIRAVHIPIIENEECRRPNRLGLQTIPSGYVKLRLHVIHQTHSTDPGKFDKLDLLEKMGSTTILRSVQTVIAAFQRARNRAANAKRQQD